MIEWNSIILRNYILIQYDRIAFISLDDMDLNEKIMTVYFPQRYGDYNPVVFVSFAYQANFSNIPSVDSETDNRFKVRNLNVEPYDSGEDSTEIIPHLRWLSIGLL